MLNVHKFTSLNYETPMLPNKLNDEQITEIIIDNTVSIRHIKL